MRFTIKGYKIDTEAKSLVNIYFRKVLNYVTYNIILINLHRNRNVEDVMLFLLEKF